MTIRLASCLLSCISSFRSILNFKYIKLEGHRYYLLPPVHFTADSEMGAFTANLRFNPFLATGPIWGLWTFFCSWCAQRHGGKILRCLDKEVRLECMRKSKYGCLLRLYRNSLNVSQKVYAEEKSKNGYFTVET